jgi:hypothetical protein
MLISKIRASQTAPDKILVKAIKVIPAQSGVGPLLENREDHKPALARSVRQDDKAQQAPRFALEAATLKTGHARDLRWSARLI